MTSFALRFRLRLHREPESDGVILRGIAPHDQNHVRVGDVGPAVRHGAAAEGGGQTGHRGAVSKTGLVLVGENPEAEAKLAQQVVDLVGVGAAADHREAS